MIYFRKVLHYRYFGLYLTMFIKIQMLKANLKPTQRVDSKSERVVNSWRHKHYCPLESHQRASCHIKWARPPPVSIAISIISWNVWSPSLLTADDGDGGELLIVLIWRVCLSLGHSVWRVGESITSITRELIITQPFIVTAFVLVAVCCCWLSGGRLCCGSLAVLVPYSTA